MDHRMDSSVSMTIDRSVPGQSLVIVMTVFSTGERWTPCTVSTRRLSRTGRTSTRGQSGTWRRSVRLTLTMISGVMTIIIGEDGSTQHD